MKKYDPSKISVKINGKEIIGISELEDVEPLKHETAYIILTICSENKEDRQQLIELLERLRFI